MNAILRIKQRIQKKKRAAKDLKEYVSLDLNKEFSLDEKDFLLIYEDSENAASIDIHYFLMDLAMARMVIKNSPAEHYDIGSRVDGFITHLLASNISVTLLDIRPFPINVNGLKFIQTDATNLENIENNSLSSLSSLHAIEHFGLGRYGDPIDPDAWKKALRAMQSKMKSGGRIYLGVPIGNTAKICFNAHRVFTPRQIIEQFEEMELVNFSYIQNYRIITVEPDDVIERITQKLGDFDCGLFCFVKK